MPRRQNAQRTEQQAAAAPAPAPEKKWAEPYRPIASNPEAGFEFGENKLTNQFVFYFAQDPGKEIKDRLKHYGYFYHGDQKAWTVNATPVTREIAKQLAIEFVGNKSRAR